MPTLPVSATIQRMRTSEDEDGVPDGGDDVQGKPRGDELAEDDESAGEDEGDQ